MATLDLKKFIELPTLLTLILIILSFAATYGRTQSQQEEFNRRIEAVEKKADRISIIENDVKWIKEFLQKKYGAP